MSTQTKPAINAQSLFSLEGKTAIVTGSRGIAKSIVLGLASAGADIILVQRDITNTVLRDEVTSTYPGRACHLFACDLAVPSQCGALIGTITAAHPEVDILVNCAGIQRRHPSHLFPSDDWDEVLQVNLTSVFTLDRDLGAYWLSLPAPPRDKRIINLASLLSFQGGLTVPAYSASKGGVAQLTKALSNEWAGKGINVNAIVPGYIATDMNEALMGDEERARSILARIPAGRWGCGEDFVGPVVFLAGRASGYVSGEMLVVDGGWMGR